MEALDRAARRGLIGMTSEQISLETDEILYWTERRLIEIEAEGMVTQLSDGPSTGKMWTLSAQGSLAWRRHFALISQARHEEEEAAEIAAALSEQEVREEHGG